MQKPSLFLWAYCRINRPLLGITGRGVAVLLLVALVNLAYCGRGNATELRIYIWDTYLHPDLVAEFEAETGVVIAETPYESEEAMDRVLAMSDGRGFDLIVVSSFNIPIYKRQGWLQPVTEAEVPNLRHFDSRWRYHEGEADLCVPYFWGTTGVAYRADLLPKPITSWREFFSLQGPAFNRRLIVTDDPNEVIGYALKALGYSYNATDARALDEAEALLLAFRPSIYTSFAPSLNERSALVIGEAYAAITYNGDALYLREFEENIAFVNPIEGAELWVDYFCLMSAAVNIEAALKFLDFMSIPENAAMSALEFYYATPNTEAEGLLPDWFLNDPLVYPPADVLAKSETARFLHDVQAMRRRYEIHSRVIGRGIYPE